ncbi:MAG: rod-binding protein [Planctomycetaceae bacterium]|nr:rod-binding protein [Planctomycetales bacterium]MCB9926002.1 rod-binding protein [Planctomycetaceae bacterium]
MNIPTSAHVNSAVFGLGSQDTSDARALAGSSGNVEESGELREAFDNFVGQTFFQQMLSAMRKTVDKPAYFHGGRTEEVFQGQLDQVLSEHMSKATADQFTDPLFDLYSLRRA